MLISIDIEDPLEPNGLGLAVGVNLDQYQGVPSDADIISLAETIVASDLVQNSPQWANPPALATISVPGTRTVYPTS